jgi:hypothetical protein
VYVVRVCFMLQAYVSFVLKYVLSVSFGGEVDLDIK